MIHFILSFLLKKVCYLCSQKEKALTSMDTLYSSWNSSHTAIAIPNEASIHTGFFLLLLSRNGRLFCSIWGKFCLNWKTFSMGPMQNQHIPLVKLMLMNLFSLNFSYGLFDVLHLSFFHCSCEAIPFNISDMNTDGNFLREWLTPAGKLWKVYCWAAILQMLLFYCSSPPFIFLVVK